MSRDPDRPVFAGSTYWRISQVMMVTFTKAGLPRHGRGIDYAKAARPVASAEAGMLLAARGFFASDGNTEKSGGEMRKTDTEAGGDKQSVLLGVLDASVRQAGKAVDPFVESLRERNPNATAGELIKRLDKYFMSTVTSSGAATGAVAAVPGVGTAASLGFATGDTGIFLTTASTYVLAVSRIHGVDPGHIEHQRALILAVLAGGSGAATVTRIAERTGGYWGRSFANAVPLQTIRTINKVLGRNFVTRYGSRTGILVLGKAAPFGVGAAIGAGGNLAMARMIIRSTKAAFGPLE